MTMLSVSVAVLIEGKIANRAHGVLLLRFRARHDGEPVAPFLGGRLERRTARKEMERNAQLFSCVPGVPSRAVLVRIMGNEDSVSVVRPLKGGHGTVRAAMSGTRHLAKHATAPVPFWIVRACAIYRFGGGEISPWL
ncbi:hypothetical protein [uncultured Bradyrhizobium sp.]|uniref:hypothetical protein n=1 Tax=uncultured Bradyrhizobium sp. TaxID=199684 RepID=UPI0035CC2892